ncbi:glycoside hydrolase superfamily [Lasiosphaeris hirsuta]|uniref:chitinase n=1 Tax=Lasiosphaeris hirsuta TaxID=260670 RepID=A0AA40EB59_9PEZI|nr:glycoside hydrolase superfamily [Lasiosphaeris hirsuta]
MLSTAFLLFTPFLLAAPASAVPRLVRDDVAPQCAVVTVTKTETVWATDPTQTPAAIPQAPAIEGPGVSPLAFTEKYNPASPQSALANPTIGLDSAPSPALVPAGPVPVAPIPAANANVSAGTIPPSTYRNSLYFTNWGIYGANYQPQQIPAGQVSHILYAFADIASDGEVKSSDAYADFQKRYETDSWNDQGNNAYGCIKQLFLLKKKNRQLKVLLSIGGWTYSPKFPPVAATEAGRLKFAQSAVKLVQDWGFDGIDIDWEYPVNAAEAQHFVLLLQAVRQALDSLAAQHSPGYRFLITIAAPAGSSHYNVMDLAGMDPYIDAWHLMAYDYAGSWDSTSGHQSNLYANGANPQSTKFSTEQAVRDYLARGIPASKIVLGMPLYGRSFEATTGIGQPYNGIGAGSIQSGVWLYRDLPRPGAQEAFDDVAQASYSYDPATKELISYDTVTSAVAKARYLVGRGLGGAVFWEASGDKTGSSSLVGTLAGQMGRLDPTENLLSFPASQYDNIRAGMP